MRELEAVVYQQIVKKLEDYKTLTGATPVLISYVNAKIEKLDSRRQALVSEIAKLTAEACSRSRLTRFPTTWTIGRMSVSRTSSRWWI